MQCFEKYHLAKRLSPPARCGHPGPLGLPVPSSRQSWNVESTRPYWTIPTCCLCLSSVSLSPEAGRSGLAFCTTPNCAAPPPSQEDHDDASAAGHDDRTRPDAHDESGDKKQRCFCCLPSSPVDSPPRYRRAGLTSVTAIQPKARGSWTL